jgi:hypothetical protein
MPAGVLNSDYAQLLARWEARCVVTKKSVRLMSEKKCQEAQTDI